MAPVKFKHDQAKAVFNEALSCLADNLREHTDFRLHAFEATGHVTPSVGFPAGTPNYAMVFDYIAGSRERRPWDAMREVLQRFKADMAGCGYRIHEFPGGVNLLPHYIAGLPTTSMALLLEEGE